MARVGDLVVHAQLEPRLGLEELCVNGLCVRLVPVAAEERYCFGADVALGKGEVIVRERELVRLGYFVWGSQWGVAWAGELLRVRMPILGALISFLSLPSMLDVLRALRATFSPHLLLCPPLPAPCRAQQLPVEGERFCSLLLRGHGLVIIPACASAGAAACSGRY